MWLPNPFRSFANGHITGVGPRTKVYNANPIRKEQDDRDCNSIKEVSHLRRAGG